MQMMNKSLGKLRLNFAKRSRKADSKKAEDSKLLKKKKDTSLVAVFAIKKKKGLLNFIEGPSEAEKEGGERMFRRQFLFRLLLTVLAGTETGVAIW